MKNYLQSKVVVFPYLEKTAEAFSMQTIVLLPLLVAHSLQMHFSENKSIEICNKEVFPIFLGHEDPETYSIENLIKDEVYFELLRDPKKKFWFFAPKATLEKIIPFFEYMGIEQENIYEHQPLQEDMPYMLHNVYSENSNFPPTITLEKDVLYEELFLS